MKTKIDTLDIAIIGAGASGLFAARELEKIAKEQGIKLKVTILEKENEVGGKCKTFIDPKNKELQAEMGAIFISPRYGSVLEAMAEQNISAEKVLPFNDNSIEIKKLYNNNCLFGNLEMGISLTSEVKTFNNDYEIYKNIKLAKKDLPKEYKLSFSEYAKLKNLRYLDLMLKPVVPGFGYGALSDITMDSLFEYFHDTTLNGMLYDAVFLQSTTVHTVHEGYQGLMKAIPKSFKYTDVKLNANIHNICRKDGKVTVCYSQDKEDEKKEIKCDRLILALPPTRWKEINLDLNPIEKKAFDNVSSYTYPAIVCKIKGFPPEQIYFPSGLEKEGFGNISLITTRDNRKDPEDGRLCTLYINLPPNTKNYKIDHDKITFEIKKNIKNVTEVTFLEEKIWEGYQCTIPWELRLKLKELSEEYNTTYLNAAFGFETVVNCANLAVQEMNELYNKQHVNKRYNTLQNMNKNFQFFQSRAYQPVSDPNKIDNKDVKSCFMAN